MSNRSKRSDRKSVPNLSPTHSVHKAPPKPATQSLPPIAQPSLADQIADMSKLAGIQRWAVENRHPVPKTLKEAEGMGISNMPAIDAAKRAAVSPQRETQTIPLRGESVDPQEDKDFTNYRSLRALILGEIQTTPVSPVLFPNHPQYDGKVFVRVWDVPEKAQLDQIILMENRDKEVWDYYTPRIVAWTVVLSACDADGDLIFGQQDIAVFLNPNADRRFTEEVWREAFDLNGIFGRSSRAITKNSVGTPNSSESSDSADSGGQASDKPTNGSDTEQFGAGLLQEQPPNS